MAPMITRSNYGDDTILQDALTMALRRAKWTHEYNTKINHRKVFGQFFGTPKILPPLTKLLPEPEKFTGGHTIASDALTNGPIWPDVFTIRAEFGIFRHRVSILCHLREGPSYSVTRA